MTEPVAGDPLAVTVAVEDTGKIEDSQTVTLDVPGLGGNETGVTLAGGASTAVTLSVENIGVGPRTGLLTVDAGNLGSAERGLNLAGGESTVKMISLFTEPQQVGTTP